MKKKRKLFVVCAIFICLSTKIFASGHPVFDAANWLAAIDRFYQGYDQIMNTIQIIEQNYQQIQQAIEQAKSWSFEDLDFNDGNFLENMDIRDEIQDATKQVNRQLNNVRKMRDTFCNENMTIGNKTFSMKDLAGLGEEGKGLIDIAKEAINMEKNDFKEAYKSLTTELSDDEKKAIWSKYGLSPQNFLMVQDADKKFREQAKAVMTEAHEEVQQMRETQRTTRANAIVKKIFDSSEDLTEKEIAQAEMLLQQLQGEQLTQFQQAVENSFAYLAWKDRRDEQLAKAQEEQFRDRAERTIERDEGFIAF